MFGIGMAGADSATVALVGQLYLFLSPVAIAVALLLGSETPEAQTAMVLLRDEDGR